MRVGQGDDGASSKIASQSEITAVAGACGSAPPSPTHGCSSSIQVKLQDTLGWEWDPIPAPHETNGRSRYTECAMESSASQINCMCLLNEPHNFYSGKTKQLRKNETWVKLSIGLSLNDETNGLPVLFLVFSA